MIEIPRIKRRIDLVDALCMIAEDAGTFDLLSEYDLIELHRVIARARAHTHKKKR
jgi:hypothetical protein